MGSPASKPVTMESEESALAAESVNIWNEIGVFTAAQSAEQSAVDALTCGDPEAPGHMKCNPTLLRAHLRAAAKAIARIEREIEECDRRLSDVAARKAQLRRTRGIVADTAVLDLVTRKMARINPTAHLDRTRQFQATSAAFGIAKELCEDDAEGPAADDDRAEALYASFVEAAAAAPHAALLADIIRHPAPSSGLPGQGVQLEPPSAAAAVRFRGGGPGGGGGGGGTGL
jgi:hypothetical protein